MTREKIIENLKDAGCDEETIDNYLNAIEKGDRVKAMGFIEKHREKLLKEFHQCSSCIDCLDYFVIQTEKTMRYHNEKN